MKQFFLLSGFIMAVFLLSAQEVEVGDAKMEVITVKEWNFLLCLNTSGFGFGYQQGKTPNYRDKHLWEIEFSYYINHKTVLRRNYDRPFCYGKLYDLFFLRGGYGYQRVITTKPYYGGVQIRYFFSFGASICIGIPTYLEIIYADDRIEIERYDPENQYHNLNYIYGPAGFFNRFHKIAIRPGFYGKTGLNFDFSKNPLKMQALEIGVSTDMIFPFIQQMAFARTKPAYFYAYIAYVFGKKKPRYDF